MARLSAAGEFGQQGALPAPGFAGDEGDPTMACEGGRQVLMQLRQFSFPADEEWALVIL